MYIYNNFIYYAHLGNPVGSEQGLDRPVLIVHTTKESPVCIVIPLTLERCGDSIPYHIDLSNGKGTALIEQIRTIDKSRIYEHLYEHGKYATINDDERNNINGQLERICRIKPLFVPQKKS